MKGLSHIILLFLFLFINNGCKKEYTFSRHTGERAKFLGDYKGKHVWNYWGHPDLCQQDNGSRETFLTVKKGDTDSTLNVMGYELCPDNSGGYTSCVNSVSIRLAGESLKISIGKSGTVCGYSNSYDLIKVK